MSTNIGVTPSSYDLIILVSKNIKRFLERPKILVYESPSNHSSSCVPGELIVTAIALVSTHVERGVVDKSVEQIVGSLVLPTTYNML